MKRFVLADGAKEEINKIFGKARVTKKEVAELLDVSPMAFYYKMRSKRSSFSAQEVKRISNGYEAQFTGIDGKLHSAYGKTELETRKKAEERMASITCPKQEKVPDDKAGINISGDEAMVLLNQLMLDLRNGAVSEVDKPILKSIYMRLAVQII